LSAIDEPTTTTPRPTTGAEAGILDLWVADKGTLGGGAGPWPLLDDDVQSAVRSFRRHCLQSPRAAGLPITPHAATCGSRLELDTDVVSLSITEAQ